MSPADVAPSPLVTLTGATGFLGGHVADLLLARGYRVRVSVRSSSNRRWLDGKSLDLVETPLAPVSGGPDGRAVDQGLAALTAGAVHVVHCAGVVGAPDEAAYERGNVESTRRLLKAAAAAGTVRSFVLVSSLAAAGPSAPGSARVESEPCRPITAYGRSKLAAERLVLDGDHPFRTAALRPPALYGPRDAAFLPLFRMARRGWIAHPGRVASLSLVDGRDAAAAVALLMADPRAKGAWFVDDGREYGFADLAAALGDAWERRVRTLRLPLPLLRAAAGLARLTTGRPPAVLGPDRIRDLSVPGWVCSGARLREELGYRAERDLTRGFAETLQFYREAGWIDAT